MLHFVLPAFWRLGVLAFFNLASPMSFLSPLAAAIAAGITVPALISLYFLKLKRRRVEVASTLLWKRTVKDMEVNSPFQKIRRNLLLFVQLLLLAALLMAMARPYVHEPAVAGQLVVLAVDHSASINATDGEGGTRLDEAKRRAKKRIDSMAAGSTPEAMVIAYAGRARILQPRTSDPAALRAAIDSIEPTDQPTDLAGAISLVGPFAQQAEARGAPPVKLHLFSDGQSSAGSGGGSLRRGGSGDKDEEFRVEGLGHAEVLFEKVGSAGPVNNVSIAAFAVRRDFEKPQLAEMFARLVNFGPESVRTTLSLELDGNLLRVEPVRVRAAGDDGPGSTAVEMTFRLAGSGVVSAYHDHDDMLASDDRAWLSVAASPRLRVLLVTEGNSFLRRGLASAGVRDLVEMTPAKYADQRPETLIRTRGSNVARADAGYDVIVFDGYSTAEVPPVSSLSFGAAPPLEGLQLVGPSEDAPSTQPVLEWERTHPLMRYVSMDDVLLSKPGRLELPDDAEVLATAQSGPILASVARDGRRHAVASFDILASNWPLMLSYPVFLSNATQTLGLGRFADSAAVSYRPGASAQIPAPGKAEAIRYTGPDTLQATPTPGGWVTPVIDRVGLYRASSDEVAPPFDRLAVSLLSEAESDIRPRERIRVASGGEAAAVGAVEGGQREIWPYFALAALVLLMAEWLLYTRRMHV